VIFVSDGNATLTDEEHNGTLMSMSAIFADVMDTNHLIGLIDRSSRTEAAA
jgi:ureidoacrylate peracid hydrolase